ncbi:MAG TPA: DEAD/DEAH box helicase family protein [Pyrinomonadaceae bacterium]|nr:DEAD/DEAH box helicase family protein [Pyrinomonadaceae bacterium]
MSLIEKAAEAVLSSENGELAEKSNEFYGRLRSDILNRWQLTRTSKTAVHDISEAMSAPPAVVRYVLEQAGQLKESSEGMRLVEEQVDGAVSHRESPHDSAKPDWSFQDVAVGRCVDALTSSTGRKVGLVLPTGAGKTRVALRIALQLLNRDSKTGSKVVWVTHRVNLRTQAHRELQKMSTEDVGGVPGDGEAFALLTKRIEFIMVSQLAERLADSSSQPLLVIVDEAHHAAAASYQPIFDTQYPLAGLFLTATPSRTDALPIGVDEIAYTITYRELAQRRVILIPEFEDFPVENFDWSEESLKDLADHIISRAAAEYTKILVLAPRISRVEEFYQALIDRLAAEPGHPLSADDVGFVHSDGNSLGPDYSTEEFLEHFTVKPRAIYVSAQILLEGFDDPQINTVVITYPSSSLILMMQAAGRCVRYAPGKTANYVVQARNDQLAYHFDQRWLYQEISDYVRPQLFDADYADLVELRGKVREELERYNVSAGVREKLLGGLLEVSPGETCRLFLFGLPYFGAQEEFPEKARWGAFLEKADNTEAFRHLFNSFCSLGADQSDPTLFLDARGGKFGVRKEFSEGSDYRLYTDMLIATHFARNEVYGDGAKSSHGASRPYVPNGATTWLKYVTFSYRPTVPVELRAFLEDCHNREQIVAKYMRDRRAHSKVVKVRLPLGGYEAYLFDEAQSDSFECLVDNARTSLKEAQPSEQFAALAAHLSQASPSGLPLTIILRVERFLSEEDHKRFVFDLRPHQPRADNSEGSNNTSSQGITGN